MTVNVQKRHSYRVKRVNRSAPRSALSPAKRIYLLLTAISAAGVFIGACSVINSDIPFELRAESSFSDSFAGSLAAVMLYVAICFFAGTSSAGSVCGYLLCLFKGMGAGFLSAEIFRSGLASVNLQAALNVLPFEAVSTAAVIFAARENIRMSRLISEKAFGNKNIGVDSSDCLRLYLMKFGVITLLAVGAALIDGLLAVAAGNMP
ncbi:MAG: hypothetical protein ACI4J0_00940 [Huintestinicola sp.]|uniref:hypothetical protein n=1 Tax=Huintestinicola sp. TaxID=2981661 RepID=UPI003F073FC9